MKDEVTKTKTVLKLLAILVALIVAMTLWSVFIDKVWPAKAHAYEYCSVETPCKHDKAARTQSNEYRDGKLRRTKSATWNQVISDEMRYKMKRAYARYINKHPYGPGVTGDAAMAVAYDWPSPKEWFRSFSSSVGCAFVGTTGRATSAYCSSGSNDMTEKTGKLANEVGRVSVKCGGDMVLGGLANDSAQDVAKKMGWRLSGGIGFYAGAAHCAWNNYFDQWWWN